MSKVSFGNFTLKRYRFIKPKPQIKNIMDIKQKQHKQTAKIQKTCTIENTDIISDFTATKRRKEKRNESI